MSVRFDIASNFVASYSWFHRHDPALLQEHAQGMLLLFAPGGLTDFNLALPDVDHLPPTALDDLTEAAYTARRFFASHHAPFSFWAEGLPEGPSGSDSMERSGTPAPAAADLGSSARVDHMGQHLDLAYLVPPSHITALEVRRITSERELEAFADIIAEGWSMPAGPYREFFTSQAVRLLPPACPKQLYIGWMDGVPACCMELFLDQNHDTAGVYYVSTREAFRRRGFAAAMQYSVLVQAAREGVRAGVVLSAPGERRIMNSLGFTDVTWWHEYVF